MAGVIRGGVSAADSALWALGISVEAVRRQVKLIKQVSDWAQGPDGSPLSQPEGRKLPETSLREAVQLARNYLAGARLPGLPPEGQAAAAQALTRLAGDLNRARQQLIAILPGYPGVADSGLAGAADAGPADAELLAVLPVRLRSVEARLSVVEDRVGTGPDVAELDRQVAQARRDRQAAADAQDYENAAVLRDRERHLVAQRASRQSEWAAVHQDLPALAEELQRTRAEVDQLRSLLAEQAVQQAVQQAAEQAAGEAGHAADGQPADGQPPDGEG